MQKGSFSKHYLYFKLIPKLQKYPVMHLNQETFSVEKPKVPKYIK